ncbi:regulator of chromosome condensation 1/beta-lactamase-inhibitor protein II [Podospora conica]|nr:regulator of chromosome condensation 1/beta-lactamase-inhibitor protein II [Schizothecium conicum]
MELYAAGLNAWNQLRFGGNEADTEPDDLHTFACVLADQDIRDVRPHLSFTTVHTTLGPLLAGNLPTPTDLPPSLLTLILNPPSTLLFAQTSTGAIAFTASPSHPIIHHPTPLSPPTTWPPTPTPPTHLVSHATGFALLHPPSTVLTTSDPRFSSCLGRPSDSPDVPHPVPDLLDLPTGPVVKIDSSSSGYVLAALTAGGDLYVWGHAGRAEAAGLGGMEVTGDVTPVVVDDHDVADVAVGEGHVVVLTTTGEVFGIGSNGNGQLGLGEEVEGTEAWTRIGEEVPAGKEVVGVVAGPRSTFLLVRDTEG